MRFQEMQLKVMSSDGEQNYRKICHEMNKQKNDRLSRNDSLIQIPHRKP
jgi:hypothetical protein